MGTLTAFNASCMALTNLDQRRWCLGAGYRTWEYVQLGYPLATAQALVLAAPQYANGLSAAGLTASFNALTISVGTGTVTPVSTFTGTATPGTDVVITTGGVSSGLTMYAAIVDRGANTDTITPPSGWTSVADQVRGSVGRMIVYRKLAGGGEPSSYTFTCSASGTNVGGLIVLSGVNATPEDATPTSQAGTVATGLHTCPSITTVTANALILRIVCTAVGALPCSWTWNGAGTEQIDVNAASTGAGGVSIATETQATAGATGTEDATFAQSSSTTYAAATIAVRPA